MASLGSRMVRILYIFTTDKIYVDKELPWIVFLNACLCACVQLKNVHKSHALTLASTQKALITRSSRVIRFLIFTFIFN